jgi:Holliday junction resolvase RusA-like endonuclease
MRIHFFIKCNPPKHTAQASSRILKNIKTGKFFIGKQENSLAAQAKNELIALMAQYAPDHPIDGPIELVVRWCYPFRASEPKKNRAAGWRHCDTRPDIDNICKMLLDCMTRLGFWQDDSQVARLEFGKYWAYQPGIEIDLTTLQNP